MSSSAHEPSAHEPFPPVGLPCQAESGLYRGPVLAKPQVVAEPGRVPVIPVLLFSALLLRLPFLGGASLWLDEMWSIATSRLPWPKLIWVILHQDSNASLYYLVLHLWLRLGSSPAMVRSLSVLLGVITIPVLYRLGNRLYGKPVALVASSLLIVSKLHVYQSQDARGYALLVLLVTLSSLAFLRCIEQPSAKHWCFYTALAVLAVYAHVFAVLVLLSHAASLVLLPRRQIHWKGVLASGGAIFALTAPLGLLLQARSHSAGAPLSWVAHATLGMFARILWALAGGSHYAMTWALVDGLALCLGYAVLCTIFLVWCVRQWRQCGRSLAAWHAGFVLTWLVLPIAVATAVSTKAPVLVDKYLIVTLPALMLAAAKGVQLLRPRWHTAATAAMVALALVALLPYFQVRARDHEWQGVTGTILSQARPGDAVLFMVAPGRLLYDYYGGEAHGQGPRVLYPQFSERFMQDPASLMYLPPLTQASLDQWASQYARVWVVLYHDEFWDTRPVAERIQGSFLANHQMLQDKLFDGTPFFERAELQFYDNGRANTGPPRSARGEGNRLLTSPQFVSGTGAGNSASAVVKE